MVLVISMFAHFNFATSQNDPRKTNGKVTTQKLKLDQSAKIHFKDSLNIRDSINKKIKLKRTPGNTIIRPTA